MTAETAKKPKKAAPAAKKSAARKPAAPRRPKLAAPPPEPVVAPEPPAFVGIGDFLHAIGRRKAAIASVRLYKNGSGKMVVNNRDADAYFPSFVLRDAVRAPLIACGQADKVDISARVAGGGMRGQAEAVRLGVARALLDLNPTFRRGLRKVGLLTRDARVKERKKPGLKKARRGPQWAKR